MVYDWPGNGRELRNTIERAVILCADGAPLDAGHLPADFGKAKSQTTPGVRRQRGPGASRHNCG